MKKIFSIAAILMSFIATGQTFPTQQEMMKKILQKANDETSVQIPEYWKNVNSQLYDYGRTGLATIQTFDTRYAGVMGSPYLYDKWMKGAVMLVNNDQPQLALLNYDCENDQLVFRNRDGMPSSLPNEMVRSFAVQDSVRSDSLNYFITISSGKPKSTFYQVLYSGKNLLLEHHKRVLRKADYQKAYNPDRRYDEYIDLNELYITNEDGNLRKIKLNKKSPLELFPGNANKLKNFIQQKDLKMKSSNDMIQVLSYLDTL